MIESTAQPASERLRRQGRVNGVTWVRRTLLLAAALGLAGGAGWWWRVGAAYQSTVQMRESALMLERELGDTGSPGHDASDMSHASALHPVSDDDVSALVRWHDLLREHHLHDWQGRSVPASTPPGSSGAGRHLGPLWRLEGAATYEQGVALLQSMVRRFPHLLLLQVQVQPLPASDLLQWRLELHWSAPATALAQRWPAGGAFEWSHPVNPFAMDRLRPAATPLGRDVAASTLSDHVLPRARLQDIRLIGVVGEEDNRLAIVVGLEQPDRATGVAIARQTSTPHRLRRGQTLGLEHTRVVAIEPRSVVVQSSRFAGPGQRVEHREVLALAGLPEAPSTDSGRRP